MALWLIALKGVERSADLPGSHPPCIVLSRGHQPSYIRMKLRVGRRGEGKMYKDMMQSKMFITYINGKKTIIKAPVFDLASPF